MAFWNIVGGTENTNFDTRGFATGTDIEPFDRDWETKFLFIPTM